MTRLLVPKDDRQRVFIGDVQGCASELEDLLEALQYRPERHALYFCGDIVNRGPRSLDALRLAHELGAESVLGNHDLHLLALAVGARESKPRDTIQEVIEAPDANVLLDWLRHRPFILEWDDLVLVHAGLHPGWTDLTVVDAQMVTALDPTDPLAHEDIRFATTVRYCDAAGNVPAWQVARLATPPGASGPTSPIPPPFEPWDHFWRGPRRVVFGHWARRGLVQGEFVRGLDTGCVWGGSLTAWIAEEDRFVSVPARAQHQPFA